MKKIVLSVARRTALCAALSTPLVVLPAVPAQAQRAGDNPVTAATDAFGTTVGRESIGLYTYNDVRGFSPVRAGNARIDGMYFDRQADLNSRLITGNSIHVGLSAQSYPFPAPTGIVDYHLRRPGDAPVVSVVAGVGPYDKYYAEVDSQVPLGDRLGLAIGVGGARDAYDWGASANSWSTAAVLHWRPAPNVEVVPFFSRADRGGWEVKPYIFLGGDVAPPPVVRRRFYSQPWTDWEAHETNYGAIGTARLGADWTLRGALFRSLTFRPQDFVDIFSGVDAAGQGTHVIIADPSQRFGSLSGELRLARGFGDGPLRHTVSAALRGREVTRLFGGADQRVFGMQRIGVPLVWAMPEFRFTERSRDHVRQATGGLSYEARWAGLGELSVGAQKTSYRRSIAQPGRPTDSTSDDPLLYNGTAVWFLTPRLALFGSYTLGLEETGVAPDNATNRGEAVPASRTRQADAGLRLGLGGNLRAVATVFEVKKPYFNLDAAGRFTDVGTVRHRGVELSLAGQLAEGLTVVAGTVFLQARLSGDLVDSGRMGRVPVGRTPRVSRINAEYRLPLWPTASVDAQLENISSRVLTTANRARLPGRTTLALGARYRFTLMSAPATLRLQVLNVTNVFGWDVDANSILSPNEPRRVQLSLAADF